MVNIIHARSGAEFIEVCPGRGLLTRLIHRGV
jgi:phospholipid N-methyltransferase